MCFWSGSSRIRVAFSCARAPFFCCCSSGLFLASAVGSRPPPGWGVTGSHTVGDGTRGASDRLSRRSQFHFSRRSCNLFARDSDRAIWRSSVVYAQGIDCRFEWLKADETSLGKAFDSSRSKAYWRFSLFFMSKRVRS